MSLFGVGHWFRCPFCGDSGKVLPWQAGRAAGIEFKCQNREHRLESGFFNRFSREVKISDFEYGDSKRFHAGLQSCITCPECGSDETDGAIECLSVTASGLMSSVILFSVWCYPCGEVDYTGFVGNDAVRRKKPHKESAIEVSQYPPDYVQSS